MWNRYVVASTVHSIRQLHALRQAAATPGLAYAAAVARGEVVRDEHQEEVVRLLDALHVRLHSSGAAPTPSSFGAGLFGALFGTPSASAFRSAPPAGLYLWGGTGSGKTMLMDMLAGTVGPSVPTRRVHFHAFMLEVHARLHAARKSGVRGDPLTAVAEELLSEARLLCFDEFQVTDVGDAMIMRRLFRVLWAGGLVVVATSNRPVEQLYASGLQRELFLPFLDDLTSRCAVHQIRSPTDYRLLATPLRAGSTWVSPETMGGRAGEGWAAIDAAVDALWAKTTGGAPPSPQTLHVQGRELAFHTAARTAARASFASLCAEALYAADYAAIAGRFDTLVLEHVPRLTLGNRNEVRRLITLVDVLYDANVKLVVSAAAAPQGLFEAVFPGTHEDGRPPTAVEATAGPAEGSAPGARIVTAPAAAAAQYDEAFAWDRTVSRLLEMQSEEYLQKTWKGVHHGRGRGRGGGHGVQEGEGEGDPELGRAQEGVGSVRTEAQ
jgi:cell division protein ZapE